MLATLPQPHQVESTMPSTSPIAQPVRQCRVALTAVDQELFMPRDHIPPRGIWQVRRLTCATSCTRRTRTPRLLVVALEHALLVSLRERPATGIELTRRFDRSIGFFWRATHQQIYKVLRRMERDGWVAAGAGDSRSTERRYTV